MSSLPDYSELLKVMKQAGSSATDAKNPVNVCFGKVTSSAPLKILVEQRITLGSAQLMLTRNVTDYDVEVTVDIETGNALDIHKHSVEVEVTEDVYASAETSTVNLSHGHKIEGKKKFKVHNALQKGDEVVLLRMQGGQKYIVIDKVV